MENGKKESKIIEDFKKNCYKTIENIFYELDILNMPIEFLEIKDHFLNDGNNVSVVEIELIMGGDCDYIFVIDDNGVYYEIEELFYDELSKLTDRILNFYLQKTGKDYKFNLH